MKRAFTTREKILLLVLVTMVIVLGYFKLILEPINNQIADYNAKTLEEQIQIDQKLIQSAQMKKMEKLLQEMKESGNYESIPSFDNRKNVINELNAVLAQAETYSQEFDPTDKMDYILARPVELAFTTKTYEAARSIIDQLALSENFNIISDLSVSLDPKTGNVSVSLRITYYEVIV